MSRRIKPATPRQRDYYQLLRNYFGFHLYGLDIREEGAQVQATVIYEDFKHIDTVRKELAQMMPEVEFVTLRREFTMSAQVWALRDFLVDDRNAPIIYIQRGDTLVKSTVRDIAWGELQQLELDEDDEKEIGYDDFESKDYDDEELKSHSME